jgi:thiamine pyrophosphokinase
MNRRAVVFANGDLPSLAVWRDLLQDDPLLVAADGGANRLREQGFSPHVIIGDLDSLDDRERSALAGVEIIHLPGQQNTDLEKALDYLIARGYSQVTVLGAMGLRSDHTLANFCILLKYQQRLHICFRDAFANITAIHGEYVFSAAPGTTVSLIPMGKCVGVSTEGLFWPLERDTLEPGVKESISNRVSTSPVRIRIDEGNVLLFVGRGNS